MSYLPNTGLNLSTPIYLAVGLISLAVGAVLTVRDSLRRNRG